MKQRIAHIALVVKDYDAAIEFYTNKLNFTLLEDTTLSEDKRWVMVAPPGAKECSLLLAKADNETQAAAIGNQTGGRVFLFLFTDNFQRDYDEMLAKGISFVRLPKQEPYGMVAVLKICTEINGTFWNRMSTIRE